MQARAPVFIVGGFAVVGMGWAVLTGAATDPLDGSSALAVAFGFVLATTIASAAMMLARAPWGRWLAVGTVGGGLAWAAAAGGGAAVWVWVAASFAALVALLGPWLRVYLRRRPSASPIGWEPVALGLGAAGLTPLVGLASPEGLAITHGLLAGAGLFFGWGYIRAEMWGLWGLRLVLVPAALLTLPATPPAGAAVLLAWSAGLTALAWTRAAGKALGTPAPVLPAPRPPKKSGG